MEAVKETPKPTMLAQVIELCKAALAEQAAAAAASSNTETSNNDSTEKEPSK